MDAIPTDASAAEERFDPAIAAWAAGKEFPEGELSEEASDEVGRAWLALRTARAAFRRHERAIGRSSASLRFALACAFAWAKTMQEKPEVLRATLERARIKATKPVRENVFLATIKLAHPQESADSHSRWAHALAWCAAQGCTALEVPEVLERTGIREAADAWQKQRAASKKKDQTAKPDPIELVRSTFSKVSLAETCPKPCEDGPFLIVAETIKGKVVAYAHLADEKLVAAAFRRAVR